MKSRSLFLAVGITLAAACVTLTAPAHATPTRTTVSAATSAGVAPAARRTTKTYARSAKRAVNRQRHRHDRRKLTVASCLRDQAQARASAMARTGRLEHASLAPVESTCGLRAAGENIAYGFPSGRSVVNRGWMHSSDHRRNMLSRHYRTMAVGAAQDGHGTWYVSLLVGRG